MTIESSPMSEPADQSPPKNLTWILIVVAAVVVVAILIFRYSISSSAPAGAKDTAQKFIDALSQGDEAAAAAQCDSTVDLAFISRQVPQIRGWGKPESVSTLIGIRRGDAKSATQRFDFSSDVNYASLSHVFTVTVTGEGSSWKVSSFRIQ